MIVIANACRAYPDIGKHSLGSGPYVACFDFDWRPWHFGRAILGDVLCNVENDGIHLGREAPEQVYGFAGNGNVVNMICGGHKVLETSMRRIPAGLIPVNSSSSVVGNSTVGNATKRVAISKYPDVNGDNQA
jgi:hypothetical protein